MKTLWFAILVWAVAPITSSDTPPADGLLSIVSFSSEEDCSGGIAISTGTWSETDNHCSPISDQRILSAKVVFLDKDCKGKR